MAGVPSSALIGLNGWPLGTNNTVEETAVSRRALRAAVNVDLDDEGRPRRRQGATLALSRPGLHSLWADDRFPYMLAMRGSELLGYDERLTETVFANDLVPIAEPGSYALVADWLYYTNGRDTGMVRSDGSICRGWGPEQPAGQPIASAQGGIGGLSSGTYQVAVTFVDDYGRESGSTLAVEVDVPEGGGIRLTSFPQAFEADTARLRIYRTNANGDVLYLASEVPAGLSTLLLGAAVLGRPLETQFHTPMPAGQIVRASNGRLLVAADDVLYWSQALHYGLTKRHENYMRLPGRISLVAPLYEASDAGVYVAAGNRTYYLSGADPKGWQRVVAAPYGAVPGTHTEVEASDLGFDLRGVVPVWMTTSGDMVAGLPGGSVASLYSPAGDGRNPTPAYQGVEDAEFGTTAMREFRGIKQLVTAVRGGKTSSFAASDTLEAEVYANGIRVS